MTADAPLIVLDPRSHVYSCGNRKLSSVGSLVKRVTPKFDADYWADRKAKQEGITKESMLARWAAKRDASCDKGHALHEAIQATLAAHMVGKEFDTVNRCALPEAAAWRKWWESARGVLTVKGLELIVGDLELGYAGTLDTLVHSSMNEKYVVLDWKSNEKFGTVSDYNRNLLPPFDDLPDCELTKYSLQVELYALALERAGQPMGGGWVLHLSPETATPHRALRLRERALEWVKGLKL